MESPENVWQFARPSNDAQATNCFLIPTQYEDFCAQSSAYQGHDRPETLQSSGTLTSSAHDVENQIVHGTTLMPASLGYTNECESAQATGSFSSMATLKDQSLQLQPDNVAPRPTPMTGVSTPQSSHEIELQPPAIDARVIPDEEAHINSARTLPGHALPGLVSFEPVVAYIDPRSQILPYNNSTAPTYQNSFYYSCMPPPLLYPPQFSTFYNHQPMTSSAKTDAYHLQPVSLHQQESRSKPRQFWTENDLRRSRSALDRLSGTSLTELCDDLPHKNSRDDTFDLMTSGKSSSGFHLPAPNPDVARKRQRSNVSSTVAQAEARAKSCFASVAHAGSNRTSARGRKATIASPTPIRIARGAGSDRQAAFLREDTGNVMMPAPLSTSAPLDRPKARRKEETPMTAAVDCRIMPAKYDSAESSKEYSTKTDVAQTSTEDTSKLLEDHSLLASCPSGTLLSAAQLPVSSESIVKCEDNGEEIKVEGACLQGQSESSMTVGAIGVIEWQKDCHKKEKEHRTKLVVHDNSNERDRAPRRLRRVSYNYSDSDLSPVPSASLENDSDDRDDVELKVNEAASTKWTDQDNARLVRLRGSGTTWPALATALGRSKRACQLKYVQLTKQAPYFFLGHPKKLDQLVQLYEERKDSFWNDIALELGCLPRVAEEKIFELSREQLE